MATPDKVERDEDQKKSRGRFIGKVTGYVYDVGEKIKDMIPRFSTPTAGVSGVRIPFINLKQADLVIGILITNPNPIPIPLIDINYSIESVGRKLVSGLISDAGIIPAHGSESVKILLSLIYDDIKSIYHDIIPGSIIPYKVKVGLIFNVPVIGRITIPLEKNGEIPIPYKPNIDVENIQFARVSFIETTVIMYLKLENKNDFELVLNRLKYELWLGKVSIAKADLLESETTIDKNGISLMHIPFSFRPLDIGFGIRDLVKGRSTGYSMKGMIEATTPFGKMELPISKKGGATRFKKSED